jgi:hypothetical protein
MKSVLPAQTDHAKDLNEVTRVGMKLMKVCIQLRQHPLWYWARASEPTPELILRKDQWSHGRFRPIMQAQVGKHAIKKAGHLGSAVDCNRSLRSGLINPVRMIQSGLDHLSG